MEILDELLNDGTLSQEEYDRAVEEQLFEGDRSFLY